jgi:hypothetical protein
MSLRRIGRKYCGPKLIDRQKNLTSRCFELAVADIMKKYNIVKSLKENFIYYIRRAGVGFSLSEGEADFPNIVDLKQDVDQRYRELICSLKSKDIEDIIWAHESGKFPRAEITLEALKTELVSRTILNTAPKTDPRIYKVGKNAKSITKKSSSRTLSKRNKRSKNRK